MGQAVSRAFHLGQENWLGLKCMHVIVKLIISRTYVSKTSSVLHLSAVFISFSGKRVEQAVEYCALYRVIHKSLRDFRTRLRNNEDRHGRKEHINR